MSDDLKIVKCFKFELAPNLSQINKFINFSGCRRFIYNLGLSEREEYYKSENKTFTYFEQAKNLTKLKSAKETKWLKDVSNQILQSSLMDLDRAYKSFFRRVKNGEKPGFPKFKKKGQKDSFRFVQGIKIKENKVYLPKIGLVKFIKHREVEGRICQATIKREGEKWFICLDCEIKLEKYKKVNIDEDKTVGIDVGVKKFAVLSNGDEIDNPKFLYKMLAKLKKEQRKLRKKILRSNNWKKQISKVIKLHIKVKNCRKDFLHKISKDIVKSHDIIAVEDLDIKNMIKNKFLSKSISDAGWGIFIEMLKYKSIWNGKHFIKINRYEATSKTCSECGCLKDMPLNERIYNCNECGMIKDRDFNASLNIRAAGLVVLSACGGADNG